MDNLNNGKDKDKDKEDGSVGFAASGKKNGEKIRVKKGKKHWAGKKSERQEVGHHGFPQESRDSHRKSIVLLQDKNTCTKPGIAERTKDSRLKGTDLYVARLGSDCSPIGSPVQDQNDLNVESVSATTTDDSSVQVDSNAQKSSSTNSLHDELTIKFLPQRSSSQSLSAPQQLQTRPSRPCYRCIEYMHAAGIKRVFWTDGAGKWEGAKVNMLIDALGNGECRGHKNGEGVFVTKHEVLMLRGRMGA